MTSSPQLFSPVTAAECPPLVDSSSSVTVRLSSVTPSPSRPGSLTTIPEGYRMRSHTDSGILRTPNLTRRGSHRYSMPPPVSPSFSQSASINSMRGSEMRLRSKSGPGGATLDGYPSMVMSPQPSEKEPPLRWWNFFESVRSWDGAEETVPAEQINAFSQTRNIIFTVIKEVGQVALPFAEDALDLLELSPIPGLQTVAKGLIGIWNAVKQVEMNRLAFLRLAHSCATILQSIHTEIVEAGVNVEQELARPLRELERAFRDIQTLMERQIGVPWLRRYLARQECLRSIDACNESLLKAMDSFKISVQVRILHAITKNPLYNKSETYIQSVVETALNNWQSPAKKETEGQSPLIPLVSPQPGITSATEATNNPTPDPVSPSALADKPVAFLRRIQSTFTEQDTKLDLEDLRQLMQDVLHAGSDVDLINFLQIMRHDMPEAIKALQRSLDRDSSSSILTSPSKDLLDREFVETGIGALRRISADVDTTLPTWTITKFEIQPDKQIGVGNFSQVLKGTWKGHTVAIKLLAKETPSELFIREMTIWKSFDHPNVLPLLGASSATGEPPWFFVSPFLKHGSLVQFLKRIATQVDYDGQGLGTIAENLPFSKSRSSLSMRCGFNRILKSGDAYGILHDVAKGMEYLHEQHVLHGDLKASNVLLDDRGKCVISDFGQSEMRSEVYRITGKEQHLQGTFRWKAPELMDGIGVLTQATDVYAYGIFCSEVLSMGEIPWPMDDDASVRYLVLVRNKRPTISGDYSSPALHELINACWIREPDQRLPFSIIVQRLHQLKATTPTATTGLPTTPSVSPRAPEFMEGIAMSPRMSSHVSSRLSWTPSLSSEGFDSSEYVAIQSGSGPTEFIKTMSNEGYEARISMDVQQLQSPIKMPQPVHYLPDGSQQMIALPALYRESGDEGMRGVQSHDDAMKLARGPSMTMEAGLHHGAQAKNELRYRLLLEHQHHSSLNLPLWTPSIVALGDVGYVSKPEGEFIVLFNAFKQSPKAGGVPFGMPSVAGYGSTAIKTTTTHKRNVVEKGFDAVAGFFNSRSKVETAISRRQSFPLRADRECAYLYVESAEHQYVKDLDAPQTWFNANINTITALYGPKHGIGKEDIFLVFGALQVQHYAHFVSHRHSDGPVHFNVFASQKKGQPWGMFTTDTHVSDMIPMPLNNDNSTRPNPGLGLEQGSGLASKVSLNGEQRKAVLLARLRFRADQAECTRR